MKNKIFRYISLFAALALIIGACESDIQKANADYDFSKVVPVVQGVSGPTVVTQTLTETYEVNYFRGGSTWAWTGTGCNITSISDDTRTVEVNFPDSGFVSLSVVETTMGGVSSEPFVVEDIYVEQFCPYPFDEWEGDYTGTSGYHSDPVTFTRTSTLNMFTIDNLTDFVYSSWGESWTSGDGTCTGTFYCGDILTIPSQVVGDSDYPDTYSVEGNGTVNPTTHVITLDFLVSYTTGDIGWQQTVLTPTGKGGYTMSEPVQIPPKQK